MDNDYPLIIRLGDLIPELERQVLASPLLAIGRWPCQM